MRVILSRKGFDIANGGQPSPVMPDGTLLSLPISVKRDNKKFTDLYYDGKSYFDIIKELKPNSRIKKNYTCHLDPDIRKDVLIDRKKNWVPVFGQINAAQTHLENKGVKVGDLFLFFGWFRESKCKDGKLNYVEPRRDLHILFGYFQIGKIYKTKNLNIDCKNYPEVIRFHSHARKHLQDSTTNTIYVASEKLDLISELPGAGCLKYDDTLVLTKKGNSRSKWDLPPFFKNVSISYHNKNSFVDGVLQSAPRGQEFVIEENPEVTNWAMEKIKAGTKK